MIKSASAKTQLRAWSIYLALAVGFTVLLLLIGVIAKVSTDKIDNISIRAGERSDDYNSRLTLASRIRESATQVVSEARLAWSRRDLKVPVLPFRIQLNEAKLNLERNLDKGTKLWGSNSPLGSISSREVEAWNKLQSVSAKFWTDLAEIEKTSKAEQGVTSPATVQKDAPAAAQPTATPVDAETQFQISRKFWESRGDLIGAADALSDAVIQERSQMLGQYVAEQTQAASEVTRRTYLTLTVGLLIAIATIGLAFSQIAALQRTTERAELAEGRESSVTDSQHNYILVINNAGILNRVNQTFLKRFNLKNSLVNQDYRTALAQLPEVRELVEKSLNNSEGKPEYRERIESKVGQTDLDGQDEVRLFDVRISVLKIEEVTRGQVIVIDDITDIEREREVYRRDRTLSAVGQITAQVAHELYNPIGAVKLNLELLEMQTGGDEDVKHTVGRLKRGLEHLSTIVMDLRYLTKPRDPERRQTDLNQLLDEVVELASDRLERTRVRIIRDYEQNPPQGNFDQQQLRKVFLNLLINALEASPQNGEVELRTRMLSNGAASELNESHQALEVSIIDHGKGMSEETKRRLFEAFYTTKRNGTGLGMMITQEIVKKHGGKIEVESEQGRGTTVSVKLPA